jgi:DNA-binding LacI/PurR family transcriptional regulator
MQTMGTEEGLPLVHEELRERLRGMIGHQWGKGERLPPIKQLAHVLGAGHVNTHRAVRQLVAEGLLVSRPRRGTVVSERGGQTARAPGPLRGKTVAILGISPKTDSFLAPLVDALARRFGELGAKCRVTTWALGSVAADIDAQRDADALVVFNPTTAVDWFHPDPRHAALVVSTSQDHRIPSPGGYDLVMVDSEQGGYQAGMHLRELGVAEVCFIGVAPGWPPPPEGHPAGAYDVTSTLRLRGFETAFGRPVPAHLRLLAADYTGHDGAKVVPAYLRLPGPPPGIFCASDDLGVGFVHGALAHGLRPGVDFKLVGFDGQQRARDVIPGGLTTIALPVVEMTRVACDLVTARLLDPARPVHRVQVAGTLRPGASTASARGNRAHSA